MKHLATALALSGSLSGLAQEQLGIANSNYAGTDAVSLNPARMAGQWPWLDVNFLGADAHVWNNHVFLNKNEHSFWGDLRGGMNGTFVDYSVNQSVAPGARKAFAAPAVRGPAFAISNGRSSLGGHITSRAAVNVVGASPELAHFMVDGLGYSPQHGNRYSEENVRISSAAWTELGLSYARILYHKGYQLITAGATVDYLMAHHGAAIRLDELDYTVVDTAVAIIHSATGAYGFAEPGVQNGSGVGFDVGVQFIRTEMETDRYLPHRGSTGCEPLAYTWRAGLSILDLGGILYDNPYTGSFHTADAVYPDYTEIDISGIEDVDSLISASLGLVAQENRMKIGLPTAVSAQFDLHVAKNVFVAADLVQNIAPQGSFRLRRPNTLGIVPRFETKRFEVAVPLVLREYDILRPGVGLMLRMNNVIIGSDHILPMIVRSDIYGFDLYFRIKWTIFKGPYCNGKKQMPHTPGDRNALPCVTPPAG